MTKREAKIKALETISDDVYAASGSSYEGLPEKVRVEIRRIADGLRDRADKLREPKETPK